MSYDTDDTIAAIGTAPGGAARGMVRISGPDVVSIVDRCFTADDGRTLDRYLRATAISGHVGVKLPDNPPLVAVECDLFLWPDERSYTRAPLAEFHTFGSPPLLEAVLAALCCAGARLAEPGEFTLRAFLAGRLDLTQAEAVLGVIDARGQDDLDSALAQLAGGLARPLSQLRDDLVQLLAELEAGLDFVDEDIQFVSAGEIADRLSQAHRLLCDVAAQMGERLTAERLEQVVLVGPPNVGKSSLFNALVARGAAAGERAPRASASALVSPERGTTRDFLTHALWLDGISCELIDTAGVDHDPSELAVNQYSTNDARSIDAAAQAAATSHRAKAAIRIWCLDATSGLDISHGWLTTERLDPARDIVVLTKADLTQSKRTPLEVPAGVTIIETSSRTGQGLDELRRAVRRLISDGSAGSGPVVATTAERCRESVRLASDAVERAGEIVADEGGEELVAAEIRVALDELGKVVGAVYTDDLLDRIFSTFCIGK